MFSVVCSVIQCHCLVGVSGTARLHFRGTPLFTIVGQYASETRCGSLDCLPLYSHNTDMVDLSKTRA